MRDKLKYYKSLDNLKILTFWKIVKDSNVRLLDIDYFEDKKYTDTELNTLNNEWFRLYDEYFILRDDSKSKSELTKGFEAMILMAKINNLEYSIRIFNALKEVQGMFTQEQIYDKRVFLYDKIKEIHPKIKFQLFNSLDLDIDYLMKFRNSLQNKYNFSYKSENKTVKEQEKNVFDVVANVESWLERSLPIDDISVSRWLAYEKQVLEKQKAQQRNGK